MIVLYLGMCIMMRIELSIVQSLSIPTPIVNVFFSNACLLCLSLSQSTTVRLHYDLHFPFFTLLHGAIDIFGQHALQSITLPLLVSIRCVCRVGEHSRVGSSPLKPWECVGIVLSTVCSLLPLMVFVRYVL